MVAGMADGGPPIQPWRNRMDPTDGRRYELFTLAAPVFARHGYRGATVQALAHACHLSPAGLYHYFESKERFATWLLRGPRLDWESTYVDPRIDPLVQLVAFVDIAVRNIPLYLLSIRLAEEVSGRADDRARRVMADQGEAVFARFIAAAAPNEERAVAEAMAADLLALLVGSAYAALDGGPERIRARLLDLLRVRLVPGAVPGDRFDAALASLGEGGWTPGNTE